jgi:tetratricopeptide (TPR) repeat protein
MPRTLRPFLLLFLLLMQEAQAQSVDQWTAWGDAALERNDRYGASRFYSEALALEPGRMELQWKYAEACRLSNQYDKAAEMYEKVQRKDLDRTHPTALRWLAEMQMCTAQYDDAQRSWEKLRKREAGKSSFEALRAESGLLGCRFAKDALRAPDKTVTIEHLAEPVNSYDSEFGGRTDSSGTLYFSTLRGKLSDDDEVTDTATYHVSIWKAPEKGGAWAAPEPLSAVINTDQDNANTAWSPDGRWFYFTRCVAGSPCAIHVSSWDGSAFGAPEPVQGLADNAISTQPMVSMLNGRSVLYYASDRENGAGGMDIWICEVNGPRILNPRPLGPTVNTPGNEASPYFEATTKTLYYSSDFMTGMGGYDIFTSKLTLGGYEPPINAGAPINSPANDLYPSFDDRTGRGMLTSNRIGSLAKKGATCCNDLYRWSVPREVKPEVVPTTPEQVVAMKRITSLREKLPLRLYFHNDEPDPRSWDTLTTLTYGNTYTAYKDLVPEYQRAWVDNPVGTTAIDAFFRDRVDLGFAQLLDFVYLLKQALEEGQRIRLVVRGFASPLAKSDYNRNLSLRRISSLVNHLRTVDRGSLVPYLEGTAKNGGRLVIEKAPFGEDRSAGDVSDVLEDLKKSVYSVGASMERRIEIEQVELITAGSGSGRADVPTIDLGLHLEGTAATVRFPITNTGDKPLKLLSAKADCGCTTATLPEQAIAPGQTEEVEVLFSGKAPAGPLERHVTINTDGDPASLVLTLTGTIVTHK